MLVGGRKITAIEACQLGFVSQVYWPTSMMQEVIPRVQHMALVSGKVTVKAIDIDGTVKLTPLKPRSLEYLPLLKFP